MAIVRESASQASGSSTAPTFTKPATLNNTDVLVVCFGVRAAVTVTGTPTGWVQIDQNIAQSTARVFAYYKVITNAAGEPASYAWTISASQPWHGGIIRYSGVDNTTPEDAASTNNSNAGSATATATGLTTVTNGARIGTYVAINATTSTTITLNGTLVSQVWDVTAQIANEFDDGEDTTAGATGDVTWTLSASRAWATIMFALRPASTGNTGSLSQTLGSFTSTSSGDLPITGSVSKTLGAFTSTGAGILPITGTLDKTLGPLTATGAGALPITGALAQTLGDVTVDGDGVLPITGALAETLDPFTLDADGQVGEAQNTGTLNQTLGAFTSTATGSLPITGALAQTLGAFTADADGALPITGTLDEALGTFTLAGAGALPITGALSRALDPFAAVGVGALPISGQLATTLSAFTLLAGGQEQVAAVKASVLVGDGGLTSIIAGDVGVPAVAVGDGPVT